MMLTLKIAGVAAQCEGDSGCEYIVEVYHTKRAFYR